MKIKAGQKIIDFSLLGIDGNRFVLNQISGRRFMLSFYRFATCPFCNLRIHELVNRYEEFGNDFTFIGIFDSPLENLIRHTAGHGAPFPLLADPENSVYKLYGIEHSWWGMVKGMTTRMPTLLKAMFFKGYIPWPLKGSLNTMPADFLVDENGLIQVAYYGKDEGDHLPFDQVLEFSRGG